MMGIFRLSSGCSRNLPWNCLYLHVQLLHHVIMRLANSRISQACCTFQDSLGQSTFFQTMPYMRSMQAMHEE